MMDTFNSAQRGARTLQRAIAMALAVIVVGGAGHASASEARKLAMSVDKAIGYVAKHAEHAGADHSLGVLHALASRGYKQQVSIVIHPGDPQGDPPSVSTKHLIDFPAPTGADAELSKDQAAHLMKAAAFMQRAVKADNSLAMRLEQGLVHEAIALSIDDIADVSPLSSAKPGEKFAKDIDQWIKQLADDDFQIRQDADKALRSAMPAGVVPIAAARSSEDSETRYRTGRIIADYFVDLAVDHYRHLLRDAFKTAMDQPSNAEPAQRIADHVVDRLRGMLKDPLIAKRHADLVNKIADQNADAKIAVARKKVEQLKAALADARNRGDRNAIVALERELAIAHAQLERALFERASREQEKEREIVRREVGIQLEVQIKHIESAQEQVTKQLEETQEVIKKLNAELKAVHKRSTETNDAKEKAALTAKYKSILEQLDKIDAQRQFMEARIDALKQHHEKAKEAHEKIVEKAKREKS